MQGKCELEYESYTDTDFASINDAVKSQGLKILEYNIDKSGNGGDSPNEKGLYPILEYLQFLHAREELDVIVLIEIARDCATWDKSVNSPRVIAQSLRMNYLYGVEFYLPNDSSAYSQCTIGNAIFTKFPLENTDQIIFEAQDNNFDNQIGKRLAVHAYIRLNKDKLIRIYSVHLESGGSSLKSTFNGFIVRHSQSQELIDHIKLAENTAVKTHQNQNKYSDFIVAGDLISPLIYYDYSISNLYKSNFNDAFYHLSFFSRVTCPFNGLLSRLRLSSLDYIFSRYNLNFENSQIYNEEDKFYGLSDHLPISTLYIINE